MNNPLKPGPKPQGLVAWPAQLFDYQKEAIQEEAAKRGKRQGNALLRDIIDFWLAHRPFFSTWVASRDKMPPPAQGK